MRLLSITFAFLLIPLMTGFLSADEVAAYKGARILTATGKVFDPGTLIVTKGKITTVGKTADVKVPNNATIHDLSGKVIIPGLVDSHSHLGVYSRPLVSGNRDGGEYSGTVQSAVRALDALNPFDPGFRMALAGGITTANVMPGSGNVIGGQTIYIKLRGHTPEQMWLGTPDLLGGLKMANGENPKRAYRDKGQAPLTRMKVASLQRAEFIKAQQYLKKWDAYRKKKKTEDDAQPPDVDLGMESLVEVLQKKRTVHFHTHRADDILTVLRLRKEFDFELVVQHGTEAYKVLDEVAAAGVPVSMTIVDSPGGKAEVVDFIEQCGAELTARGVKVHVNTDDPITESRFFLRTTAATVRGGLAEDVALKAITLYPAEALHLDDRVGSLEAGKDADFVVLNGEPFSIYTRVLQTYIEGRIMFDLNDDSQRHFQLGGFAIADKSRLPERKPLAEPLEIVEAPAPPKKAMKPKLDSEEFVVLAGRLHTVANGTIKNAAILVRDGKIVGVGPASVLKFPEGMPFVSAAVVTPGLIDAHSVVPLAGEYNIAADQDQDETSDPNQADVRALDAFHPAEPLLRFLLEQGVTVVHACPGRANVIGGLTGVFRTHGQTAESMALRFPHAMLFNLGEPPKQQYNGKKPASRMGTAALIRSAFTEAANHQRKLAQANKDDEKTAERDLKHEHLSLVLNRKVRAMICAQRADDILTALRLTREFKLDGVVALANEAYLVTDEIAKSKVPVVAHPTMQRVGGMETYNTVLANAGALADAGIQIAIGSGVEGYVPKSRVVRYEAAMAMTYGLGYERALKSITLDAAKILGIDDRLGSVEVGKIADLVLYDGDPFEHATHVTHVMVDGKLVFRRADKPAIPLAGRRFYSIPDIPCCLGF